MEHDKNRTSLSFGRKKITVKLRVDNNRPAPGVVHPRPPAAFMGPGGGRNQVLPPAAFLGPGVVGGNPVLPPAEFIGPGALGNPVLPPAAYMGPGVGGNPVLPPAAFLGPGGGGNPVLEPADFVAPGDGENPVFEPADFVAPGGGENPVLEPAPGAHYGVLGYPQGGGGGYVLPPADAWGYPALLAGNQVLAEPPLGYPIGDEAAFVANPLGGGGVDIPPEMAWGFEDPQGAANPHGDGGLPAQDA